MFDSIARQGSKIEINKKDSSELLKSLKLRDKKKTLLHLLIWNHLFSYSNGAVNYKIGEE
jgi:hypothetical protein